MRRFREIKETRPLCEAVSCEKEVPVVRDFESLPLQGSSASGEFVDPYPGGGEMMNQDQNLDGIFFDPFPGDVSPE